MFIVEANHEAKDERKRGLEWTGIGQSGGGDNEQVEEETECCETNKGPSNGFMDGEVVGECTTEGEESNLEYEG